jgi:hypothetical protein
MYFFTIFVILPVYPEPVPKLQPIAPLAWGGPHANQDRGPDLTRIGVPI